MKSLKLFILLVTIAFLSACVTTTGTGAKSGMQGIIKKRELVVGTTADMPPLNMKTKGGDIIGMEPDIARSMAKAMGVKLRFEVMPFSELLPALEKGKVDMVLSGMTITPERNLKVAFVGPYFISGKAFLTKVATIAFAKDPSEVDDTKATLVALEGSTSQYFVEEMMGQVKLVTAKDYKEAVNMVLQGKVDAMIADYPICLVSVFRYPDAGLVSVVTPLTYEPVGVAVNSDDAHLINWVENFLKIMEDSGQLIELQTRWLKDKTWLNQLP